MKAHFILYVNDQSKSAQFYQHVLQQAPTLNVPGMTEFALSDGAILGLMPKTSIQKLLGAAHFQHEGAAPRAELYLLVDDPAAHHQRALEAGALELSALSARDWGHLAAYSLDLDRHVLVFAKG